MRAAFIVGVVAVVMSLVAPPIGVPLLVVWALTVWLVRHGRKVEARSRVVRRRRGAVDRYVAAVKS